MPLKTTSLKDAVAKIDIELERVNKAIMGLEAEQSTLLLARSFMVDEDAEGEVKRLPAPTRKGKGPRKVRKSKGVPEKTDVDTDCPLEWELAGVSFTLKLNEALLMRCLSGGEGDEALICSQDMLLDALGRPAVGVMFTALRGLRSALYEHKTAHIIESIRGESYRLVAEEA